MLFYTVSNFLPVFLSAISEPVQHSTPSKSSTVSALNTGLRPSFL